MRGRGSCRWCKVELKADGSCPYHWRCRWVATETALLVSNAEIEDPLFIRDARAFSSDRKIPDSEWLDALHDMNGALKRHIINVAWLPVELDLGVYGVTEAEIDTGEATLIETRIREWFRDTLNTPCPANVTPRVRIEARERFRIAMTLLRATYPREAIRWGVRPHHNRFRSPKTALLLRA